MTHTESNEKLVSETADMLEKTMELTYPLSDDRVERLKRTRGDISDHAMEGHRLLRDESMKDQHVNIMLCVADAELVIRAIATVLERNYKESEQCQH